MMPHKTPPKHPPSRRELREERARAFWQAQTNEGRAQRAEEQSTTKKPAAIPEAPEPAEAPQAAPPPAPLPEISAEPAADVMQAVDAAHLAGMASSAIPAVNRILDVIEAGLRDGRRFSVAPQAKDRAAWRIVQGQVPALSDNEAQAVIDTWLQNGAVETRSYQDPVYRRDSLGLFVNRAKSLPR
jgi:hypothetical protein